MTQNTTQQFVIQEHQTPQGIHWDLMLQMGKVLWTWRLNSPPQDIKDKLIGAERIADHPLRFLTYEGPVQSGTGRITIADKGTYILLEQTDTALVIDFHGERFNGQFILSKSESGSSWKL